MIGLAEAPATGPRTFVAIDLEATASGDAGEIIELACVRFRGDDILDEWHTLVRPRQMPGLRVEMLTGITGSSLDSAPDFDAIRDTLRDFIGDAPLVAHSIELDRDRLVRQGLHLTNLGLDTFELAAVLLPGLPAYSLNAVASALAIPVDAQHRALADARTNQQVFSALCARLASVDPRTLRQIYTLLARSDWPLRMLFADALALAGKRPLVPLFPVARSRTEPSRERDMADASGAAKPVDPEQVTAIFAEGGPLASRLADYQPRPQQLSMSLAVTQAFNAGERLLVEAGTGTGKTLAYLVPAALWAIQNHQRVVISTNTVNLQDQIYDKDIPDLQRALGQPLYAHVLKGRSHYLCLLRWLEFRNSRAGSLALSALESRLLVKVMLWHASTATGDVAELFLTGDELGMWNQINATQETCVNDRCIHKSRQECYLFNARRRAEAADIVIVNHALLLSDIATESRVLPPYEHVVIDEAHHLEEQATHHLGFSLSRRELFGVLTDVYHATDSQRASGVTAELRHLLPVDTPQVKRLHEHLADVETATDRSRQEADVFFDAIEAVFDAAAQAPPRPDVRTSMAPRTQPAPDRELRITPGVRHQPLWERVEIAWDNLNVVLTDLQGGLEHLQIDLDALPDQARDGVDHQASMVISHTKRLRTARDEVNSLVASPSTERIYWFELGERDRSLSLHAAPLHVGKLLEESLYASLQSVVLTSATLTVSGSFSFVRERLGLADGGERTLKIGAPFAYDRQALILLPEDMVEPNAQGFQDQVNQVLIGFATATRGRCLVLFTSHASLRATLRGIKGPLEKQQIPVVGQGIDGSRQQLVNLLRSTQGVVVLGSASFWEGIDVAGEALSALAIVRLPFTVPTDPVYEARSEGFDRPFDEFAVPQAVLRFKQGFGRLIRTVYDRGVLLVLDRRITSKYYGQQFLRSLPGGTQHRCQLGDVPALATQWLAQQAGSDAPTAGWEE